MKGRLKSLLSDWGWGALLVGILAGLAAGYALTPRSGNGTETQRVTIRLLGVEVEPTPEAADKALEAVREHTESAFELRLPNGEARAFAFGRLGVVLDKARLLQLVRDAGDRTSALRRIVQQGGNATVDLPLPLTLDTPQAMATLLALKETLDRPAVDARVDLAEKRLIPEREGWSLDVDRSLHTIETALGRGALNAQLAVATSRPSAVSERAKSVVFDTVLGRFETHYDRSERSRDRTFNLRRAAQRFDGFVLLPGATFDFNAVVGPRDEAHGYRVATVIAQGELVDGIGGGTCQVSGTLHGAAFFAGLDIVERYPHTRPSSYIKMGLDATVVYPTINFRIQNPFEFPVVLHETVEDGVVRAEVLGPSVDQAVTLIRRIEDAIPYTEVERPDPNLARGTRVLAQRGVPGFKLKRYRILREGGHARRQTWRDTYPPTAQIVTVGTGDPDPKKPTPPANDPHPEYVADELLVVTAVPTSPGKDGTTETREAGRFGTRGWTAKRGMPVWTIDD